MKQDKGRRLKGAEIVVEVLCEESASEVFGYPGGQVLPLYEALYQARDRITHRLTAHEQGAAHAADGFARVSGRVGVVIATSGPGATNLVTGIATAMLDSVPMVAITGNVATSTIGKDGFQEVDITGITMPITKHNFFVTDVVELADTLREAFRIARSGRPGPVLVDIPRDVQEAVCLYEKKAPSPLYEENKADEEDIAEAVALIGASARPYLYIGGGAARLGLGKEILALADKLDAFVGCSFMGLSALPNSADRFLGMQGMHGRYASSMACKEADLILGIGVRFSDRATGDVKKFGKNARIIQLDAEEAEINKNVRVDVGIAADTRDAFVRIASACEKASHPEWAQTVFRLKQEEARLEKEREEKAGERLTPKKLFDTINACKTPRTIFVTDVGQHQMWTAQYASFEAERRFASSGGLGTMGYGLGASVGAQIASGERVVLITGDGSFGMNLTELATAVTYRLPITIVLFNNRSLGMVRQWQHLFFDKHDASTRLERKTDFVKVAEAFGAAGCRVESAEAFDKAFRHAFASDGPFLIEAVIDRDEFVFPMLPPGGSADEMLTADKSNKKSAKKPAKAGKGQVKNQ